MRPPTVVPGKNPQAVWLLGRYTPVPLTGCNTPGIRTFAKKLADNFSAGPFDERALRYRGLTRGYRHGVALIRSEVAAAKLEQADSRELRVTRVKAPIGG
jgi:hypothetical protein